MRRVTFIIALLAAHAGGLATAPPAAAVAPDGAADANSAKVAIIVGPVGAELTPVYIELAEMAAAAAEERGATVATAYSPEATAERVLEAVEDANIVVYLGHGVGSPNPYSDHPSPATTNGWGLNGPRPSEDHADSVRDGSLAYYGEAWIAAHARPAPGFVMIYSNACYAPGAGEGFDVPATEEVAVQRVSAYSRVPLAELGASAYFATDFYAGAAHLVGAMLDDPSRPYADVFASEPRFEADAVARLEHASVDGAAVWLQRTPYFEGKSDYWYAFAGDPTASLAGATSGSTLPAAVASARVPELSSDFGFVTGLASSYRESAGWEGEATVALPVVLGGHIPTGAPDRVIVCADRCVTLPVVDSCPCYVGTPDQRVVNLSHAAWRLVTDIPLAEGLIPVEVYLDPTQRQAGPPPGGPPSS